MKLPTPSAAASSAAAAASSSGAIRFGASFIDAHRTAGDLSQVDFFNRFLCLIAIRHFHKGETARTPGFTILDDVDRRYLTVFGKRLPNVLLRKNSSNASF